MSHKPSLGEVAGRIEELVASALVRSEPILLENVSPSSIPGILVDNYGGPAATQNNGHQNPAIRGLASSDEEEDPEEDVDVGASSLTEDISDEDEPI